MVAGGVGLPKIRTSVSDAHRFKSFPCPTKTTHRALRGEKSEGSNPWRRWIDTALDAPHDIVPWQTAPAVPGCTYRAEARSVVVLFASADS